MTGGITQKGRNNDPGKEATGLKNKRGPGGGATN